MARPSPIDQRTSTVLEGELSEDIRAISSKHVFAKSGTLMDCSVALAVYDSYDLSFMAHRIQLFLSHSWKTSGWLKVLGLRYFLYFAPAMLIASFVSVGLSLAEVFGLLKMPMLGHCVLSEGRTLVFNVSYSWWLGAAVFALVFYFGEYIIGSRTCFVDRCCIHQENIELKENGIRALGDILKLSDKLVILWQREYFTRLWCTFEIATYMRFKGTSDIVLVPLNHVPFMLLMTTFHIVAAMGLNIVAPFFAWSPWFAELVDKYVSPAAGQVALMTIVHFGLLFSLYMVTTPFAFNFFRKAIDDRRILEEQLANYDVMQCKCADERDRPFVEEKVLKYFGSLEDFNKIVRRDMRKQMESVLGRTIMPYSKLLMMEWGHVTFAVSLFVNTPEKSCAHLLIMWFAIIFATDMLAMFIIQHVVTYIHDSSSNWVQANAWWFGPITLAAIFGLFTSCATICGSPVFPAVWKTIPVLLAVLFTWKVYGLCDADACNSETKHYNEVPQQRQLLKLDGPDCEEDGILEV